MLTAAQQAESDSANAYGPAAWLLQHEARLGTSFLVVLIGLLLVYSIAIGQDLNWDQRNQHYYSGYALWHGLGTRDIMPGQHVTYLNPLPMLPPYLAIANLPPRAAALALTLLHAVNIVLVYLLARLVFRPEEARGDDRLVRYGLVFMATLIGATGPMFLSEVGGSFTDHVSSIPLLLGLIAVVMHLRDGRTVWVLTAGLGFGAAAGLKLTNVVFVIGIVLSFCWLFGDWRQAATRLALFGVAIAAGLALTHGYWSVFLWQEFESPIFPYFNEIFRSPYWEESNLADRRWLPSSALDGMLYPFRWAIGQHPSAEVPFRDLRFAALTALFVAALLRVRLTRPNMRALTRPDVRLVLALFVAVSFVVWLARFGISRYLMPLEMISGVVLLSLVAWLVPRREHALAAAAVVTLLVVATTRPADWGRVDWQDDWFGLSVPAALQGPEQMFLMLDSAPMAYVIPFFPPDSRFIRIETNVRQVRASRMLDRMRAEVDGHDGPVYTLWVRPPLPERHDAVLAEWGLRIADAPCVTFESRADRFAACPLERR